jgi:hypothetical protein
MRFPGKRSRSFGAKNRFAGSSQTAVAGRINFS